MMDNADYFAAALSALMAFASFDLATVALNRFRATEDRRHLFPFALFCAAGLICAGCGTGMLQ